MLFPKSGYDYLLSFSKTTPLPKALGGTEGDQDSKHQCCHSVNHAVPLFCALTQSTSVWFPHKIRSGCFLPRPGTQLSNFPPPCPRLGFSSHSRHAAPRGDICFHADSALHPSPSSPGEVMKTTHRKHETCTKARWFVVCSHGWVWVQVEQWGHSRSWQPCAISQLSWSWRSRLQIRGPMCRQPQASGLLSCLPLLQLQKAKARQELHLATIVKVVIQIYINS